jgi:hypothetical protein
MNFRAVASPLFPAMISIRRHAAYEHKIKSPLVCSHCGPGPRSALLMNQSSIFSPAKRAGCRQERASFCLSVCLCATAANEAHAARTHAEEIIGAEVAVDEGERARVKDLVELVADGRAVLLPESDHLLGVVGRVKVHGATTQNQIRVP